LIEEKVHPLSPSANKTIREINLPNDSVIVAIIRKNQLFIPHGDSILEPADEVLALVHASQLKQLAALLGPKEPIVRDENPV
jgi:Trk K+ transport system NAD-binding subunit